MLNVYTIGKEKYLTFRKEMFLHKTTRFSNTIHHSNLKTMTAIRNKPQMIIRKMVKEMNIADRSTEIAWECGLSTQDLLKYDIVPFSVLLDAEGMMTKPASKESVNQEVGGTSQT